MKFGLNLPNMNECSDPKVLAELAVDAENAGWDGVFVWDSIFVEMKEYPTFAMCDPWIALAAIAVKTERVRIGPIITPLSRRRPWKVARETVTLDHLSNGRLNLLVGLGAIEDGGFSKVGEDVDRKLRAERLDESLAILKGLWSGSPFSYSGKHYQLEEMTFLPTPVNGTIPIWVVAAWNWEKSMQRAIQYEGILPGHLKPDRTHAEMTPEDFREMKDYIKQHRTHPDHIDVVIEASTPGDDPEKAASIVRPFAEAGVTWWLESAWEPIYGENSLERIRQRIQQGPPNLNS